MHSGLAAWRCCVSCTHLILGSSISTSCQPISPSCQHISTSYQHISTYVILISTYVNLYQPHINLYQPHINLYQPHINLYQPHINLFQPHINLISTYINLYQPHINRFQPISTDIYRFQPISTSYQPHINLHQPHINLISTYFNLISTYFHPCQADDFAGGVASITSTNNACALRKSRVGGVHAVREARNPTPPNDLHAGPGQYDVSFKHRPGQSWGKSSAPSAMDLIVSRCKSNLGLCIGIQSLTPTPIRANDSPAPWTYGDVNPLKVPGKLSRSVCCLTKLGHLLSHWLVTRWAYLKRPGKERA